MITMIVDYVKQQFCKISGKTAILCRMYPIMLDFQILTDRRAFMTKSCAVVKHSKEGIVLNRSPRDFDAQKKQPEVTFVISQ